VIDAQVTPAERLPYADVVIDNSGGLEQLRGRVDALWLERSAGAEA
jgi:dephospho-CoA kinase